jgi:hypothetical protein
MAFGVRERPRKAQVLTFIRLCASSPQNKSFKLNWMMRGFETALRVAGLAENFILPRMVVDYFFMDWQVKCFWRITPYA